MSVQDEEWFDKLEQLESWINIFTKRCTTECLRTVVDVADKMDQAVEFVVPKAVQLTNEEEQIRSAYLRKIQKIKQFRKSLYKNEYTQRLEKEAAKRDLMNYAQQHKHEIITIILKFRAAGFISPIDPHDDSTEDELKILSPMEQRDRADAELKQLFKDMHMRPPNLKRVRELEEKQYQRRQEINKHIKPEPKEPEHHAMEWLTDEERQIRDELLIKQQQLTDAETRWTEAEKLKIPGTKASAMMDKKQAKLELLRFETSHMNQIRSMKRKYKKQAGRFPTNHQEVELDDKAKREEQERHAVLREKLKHSSETGKAMVELSERMERELDERKRMIKVIKEEEERKKRMEKISYDVVPVKKVDFEIYDDKLQLQKKEDEMKPKFKYGASVKPKKNPFWKKMMKSKGKKSRGMKPETGIKRGDITLKDVIGDEGVEAVLNEKKQSASGAHLAQINDGMMDVYLYDVYENDNMERYSLMDADQELKFGYEYNNNIESTTVVACVAVGLLVMIVLCFVCGIITGAWNGYWLNTMRDTSDTKSGSKHEYDMQEI